MADSKSERDLVLQKKIKKLQEKKRLLIKLDRKAERKEFIQNKVIEVNRQIQTNLDDDEIVAGTPRAKRKYSVSFNCSPLPSSDDVTPSQFTGGTLQRRAKTAMRRQLDQFKVESPSSASATVTPIPPGCQGDRTPKSTRRSPRAIAALKHLDLSQIQPAEDMYSQVKTRERMQFSQNTSPPTRKPYPSSISPSLITSFPFKSFLEVSQTTEENSFYSQDLFSTQGSAELYERKQFCSSEIYDAPSEFDLPGDVMCTRLYASGVEQSQPQHMVKLSKTLGNIVALTHNSQSVVIVTRRTILFFSKDEPWSEQHRIKLNVRNVDGAHLVTSTAGLTMAVLQSEANFHSYLLTSSGTVYLKSLLDGVCSRGVRKICSVFIRADAVILGFVNTQSTYLVSLSVNSERLGDARVVATTNYDVAMLSLIRIEDEVAAFISMAENNIYLWKAADLTLLKVVKSPVNNLKMGISSLSTEGYVFVITLTWDGFALLVLNFLTGVSATLLRCDVNESFVEAETVEQEVAALTSQGKVHVWNLNTNHVTELTDDDVTHISSDGQGLICCNNNCFYSKGAELKYLH